MRWDDPWHFLTNPHYRGFSWANLRWMFTSFEMGNYQPLAWVTLAVDYKLWGLDPHGYHLTSVLIHCVNAGLLCGVCSSLLDRRLPNGEPAESDAAGVAPFLGALLWSLHPLRVESVAWVTERRDVVSAFFFLLSVLAYLRWARQERRPWLWASAGFTFLSLLSKSMAVTMPVLLVILDLYPLRRGWRLREKAPFWLLTAVFLVVAYAAQATAKAAIPLSLIGIPERLGHAAYGLVFYLSKTLWPSGLAAMYEWRLPIDPFAPRFLASEALALALAAGLWRQRRRLPGLAAASAFYAAAVSPVLGLVACGAFLAADRYTYIPMMGFSALAAGALSRSPLRLLVLPVLLAFAGLTWRQCGFWKDTDALWGRVLALAPDTATALHNMGVEAMDKGDWPGAVRRLRQARILLPHAPITDAALAAAHFNRGNALRRQGRRDAAAYEFRLALGLNPSYAEAHCNLGLTSAESGRLGDALRHYDEALRLKPGLAAAHHNRGNALADLGRPAEAEQGYREALRLDGALLDARFNLGNVLARQGRYAQAASEYRTVLKTAPDSAGARENLAKVLRLAGR